jgi:hypothetical protein
VNYEDLSKEEQQDFWNYIADFMALAMEKTHGYQDFMESNYLRQFDEWVVDVVSDDAIAAGL